MVAALIAQAQVDPAPEPVGLWLNPRHTVIVEVARCETLQEALCGRVRWASERAIADAGRGGTTDLVGSELMQDFVRLTTSTWRGRLFVPDLRKGSRAELRLLDAGNLKITGCTAAKLFCRSQVWTRIAPQQVPLQSPPAAR